MTEAMIINKKIHEKMKKLIILLTLITLSLPLFGQFKSSEESRLRATAYTYEIYGEEDSDWILFEKDEEVLIVVDNGRMRVYNNGNWKFDFISPMKDISGTDEAGEYRGLEGYAIDHDGDTAKITVQYYEERDTPNVFLLIEWKNYGYFMYAVYFL